MAAHNEDLNKGYNYKQNVKRSISGNWGSF